MTLILTHEAMCTPCAWNGACPINYEYDYLSGKCHRQYLRSDLVKTISDAIFFEDSDESMDDLIEEFMRNVREREKGKLLQMIKKAQAGGKSKLANMLMLELENNMREVE